MIVSNIWYDKHWLNRETDDFRRWFLTYYGPPEDYDEQGEYWTRRGFALIGWLAALERGDNMSIKTIVLEENETVLLKNIDKEVSIFARLKGTEDPIGIVTERSDGWVLVIGGSINYQYPANQCKRSREDCIRINSINFEFFTY